MSWMARSLMEKMCRPQQAMVNSKPSLQPQHKAVTDACCLV